MKYRISTDYQQADGPPAWNFQDNIVLSPKNIAARTKAFVAAATEAAAGANPQLAAAGARLVERAEDEYFSRMGWFTRTHPLELPSGRLLVPMYSDGYSFGIMAISDDGGVTWKGSEPIVGLGGIQPSVVRRNDGTLVAYLRDNGPAPKRALVSESKDDCESWTFARQRHPQSGNQRGSGPVEQRSLDHGLQRSRTAWPRISSSRQSPNNLKAGRGPARRHLTACGARRHRTSITTRR